VLDGSTHVRGLEELLGGNAPAVQTGSTDLVTLHHGDIESGGGGVERGGVAPGSSSDYDNIELLDLVCHGRSLQSLSELPPGES
jgi:hypothetical protein